MDILSFMLGKAAGGGGGGGGGLEYEEGTWTPSEDTNHGSIAFANQHTEAPVFYALVDTSDRSNLSDGSVYTCSYIDYYKIFGAAFPWNASGSSVRTVNIIENYMQSGATSTQTGNCAKYSSDSGDSSENYPRFWAKETGIYPYVINASRYFRANHTFKWIAIWMPETA